VTILWRRLRHFGSCEINATPARPAPAQGKEDATPDGDATWATPTKARDTDDGYDCN
jgi:hypothetical protein